MMKILALLVVLGVTAADPVKRSLYHHSSNGLEGLYNDVSIQTVPQYELVSHSSTGILDIVTSLLKYKSSALSIASAVIDWMFSNVFMIGIGAVAVIGLCKITGLCDMSNYEQYIPIDTIQEFATPEVLEQAENFLYKAFETYAEKKKREA